VKYFSLWRDRSNLTNKYQFAKYDVREDTKAKANATREINVFMYCSRMRPWC